MIRYIWVQIQVQKHPSMLRYISQTSLFSLQILQQIPTCSFHVMDVVFMVVWLFQQAEIELGEDTMPLKIGELKLVLN